MPLLLDLWPLPEKWSQCLARGTVRRRRRSAPCRRSSNFFETIVPSNVVAAAANDSFLPLTVFALAFAFAITQLAPEPRERLTDLFQAFTDAMLVIIGWVLKLAPIGIFALAYGVAARPAPQRRGGVRRADPLYHPRLVDRLYRAARGLSGRDALRPRLAARFARAVAPAQAVAISTQTSLASLPAMLNARRAGRPARQSPASPADRRRDLPRDQPGDEPRGGAVYRASGSACRSARGALAAGVVTAAITTMGSVSLPGTISFFASVAPVALAMGVPIEALGAARRGRDDPRPVPHRRQCHDGCGSDDRRGAAFRDGAASRRDLTLGRTTCLVRAMVTTPRSATSSAMPSRPPPTM